MDEQTKNLILAMALSMAVILGWQLLFPTPVPDELPQEVLTGDAPANAFEPPAGEAPPDSVAAIPAADIATSPAEAPRIDIESSRLTGSLSLAGGRIDDLTLNAYFVTQDPEAPNVRLLAPEGQADAYFALFGWRPAGQLDPAEVPGISTPWQAEAGARLTPESPVELSWTSPGGLVYRRTISVDDDYLFTVTQSVTNSGAASVRLGPYGLVARQGAPDIRGFWILHEGMIQVIDGIFDAPDYDDMPDFDVDPRERAPAQITEATEQGWVGFTDQYWMTTLIPDPGTPFQAVGKYTAFTQTYQTDVRMPIVEVPVGETHEVTTHLFAGAKEWEAITRYQDTLGIERFDDSIDWGWFFYLTKPIFWLLHHINLLIGNMGWAIIALTLVIKAILFPLAWKSYVSMAKMKELQPEMEKIKERVGDDREKLQKEMMELYRKRKVNPAAGCLPILVQIPIFFSLYKVLFVTIEMRHAPFVGWIQDLSAPDPTSILNLFGLLPFDTPDPTSFLFIFSIGVWPILLGISMWLQQKLNPAPPDPTQRMIFAWLPWIFMFMLGTFASGLVIYWVANNLITFAQQYLIMRSQGVKPDLLGNIRGKQSETKPPSGGTSAK